MSKALIAILALASVVTSGCFWNRRARAMTHPPPRVFVPAPVPPLPSREAPELPSPPPVELTLTDAIASLDIAPPHLPPPLSRIQRRRPRAEAPAVQEAGVANVEEPAGPVPQLGEILSPERHREFQTAIDQEIAQAEKSLGATIGHRLSAEQAESASLIRSFLSQARESRAQDPVRARSLAERAAVLAQHLEKSIR